MAREVSHRTRMMLNDDRMKLIRMMMASPIANENAAVVQAVCELLMQGQPESLFHGVLDDIESLEGRVNDLLEGGVDSMETIDGRVSALMDAVIEIGDQLESLKRSVSKLKKGKD
jgi:prophage DNA circulation protein